jgi:alkanesulfonate monooxygenase SsuD/methylene tetrahydromethanopterin reductase-like flavin-dependent oxidoreductase (luciferase family)
MEFGIFDHLDRSGTSLGEFYEQRFKLAEAYDRNGFYGYHVAEHHFTPLGMAPSPSVYLSAIAQRTRRLRFGPLVYLLPLYHPLRLIEEVGMLDQMSGGRMQVGVGRGISPIEVGYYGQDPDRTQAIYEEALQVLLQGLSSKVLDFEGRFFSYRDVPMEITPIQRPHPPLWMGINSVASAEAAAHDSINIVCLMSAADMRSRADRYRAVWRQRHGGANTEPKIGLSYFIVVAPTDGEAMDIAGRAYERWHANFHHLYRRHGRDPVRGIRPLAFDQLIASGQGIAGSPATVTEFLRAQVEIAAINYLVGQFAFGDMCYDEAGRSVELFARDVIPALRRIEPAMAAG